MNLENVNAILLWEDGIPHAFGEKEMLLPSQLSDENYHDPSFLKEIYPTEWFQNLGFPYQPNQSFGRQMGPMAAYGFTILCNASSTITGHDDYYCYIINVPENMSENVREYLENSYDDLKRSIDEHQAFFQGTAFASDGSFLWPMDIFYIDEFYDKLGLSKGKKNNI